MVEEHQTRYEKCEMVSMPMSQKALRNGPAKSRAVWLVTREGMVIWEILVDSNSGDMLLPNATVHYRGPAKALVSVTPHCPSCGKCMTLCHILPGMTTLGGARSLAVRRHR